MNKNQQTTATPTPGVEDAKNLPTPDLHQIEEWLTRDLSIAVTLLTAIHNDKDLQRQMATWFLGKINNEKNKQVNDLSKTDLTPKR